MIELTSGILLEWTWVIRLVIWLLVAGLLTSALYPLLQEKEITFAKVGTQLKARSVRAIASLVIFFIALLSPVKFDVQTKIQTDRTDVSISLSKGVLPPMITDNSFKKKDESYAGSTVIDMR